MKRKYFGVHFAFWLSRKTAVVAKTMKPCQLLVDSTRVNPIIMTSLPVQFHPTGLNLMNTIITQVI